MLVEFEELMLLLRGEITIMLTGLVRHRLNTAAADIVAIQSDVHTYSAKL